MVAPARRTLFVCALLAALTLVAYGPVWRLGFIDFDDPIYVSDNREVLRGLSGAGIAWAFTTTTADNWHPLTWLSLMLDASFGGANPRIYHATNLALHLSNVLLLFLVLRRLTGCPDRSALVAALFAVHPLHVESVAWIAERKDVLSTLFAFLTLAAYARYAARPGASRYLAVVAALALGLMAKPMLVSLPFVLLLLDYWPLRRFDAAPPRDLLVEKIPLAGLAAASSIVTLVVQRPAMSALQAIPIWQRAGNAVVSAAVYLEKTIWPSHLAIFYPYPRGGALAVSAGAGLVLTGVTVASIVRARRSPWLPVGWFWYVGTLVPVLGLVQVGSQARADRHTYMPLVGLFIMAAWSIPNLSERKRVRAAVYAGAVSAVLALAACTFVQAAIWESDLTLFSHAAASTRDNAFAHFKIADALDARGEPDAAVAALREALRIQPDYAKAHFNLTGLLARQGRIEEVAALCREEQARWPGAESTLIDLGVLSFLEGHREEAAARFSEALRLYPDSIAARHNLAALSAPPGEPPPFAAPRSGSPGPK